MRLNDISCRADNVHSAHLVLTAASFFSVVPKVGGKWLNKSRKAQSLGQITKLALRYGVIDGKMLLKVAKAVCSCRFGYGFTYTLAFGLIRGL